MGLQEDVEVYREKTTRMVGLHPNPPDRSEENGLLFSATYLMLLSLETTMVTWDRERAWFIDLVRQCQIEPGLIHRYPGGHRLQAHDDLIGVAWVDRGLAEEILDYGKRHRYSWNTDEPGKWTVRTFFYRFGAFVPYLKVRTRLEGDTLSWWDQMMVMGSYLHNLSEPAGETSGRCLLFMMAGELEAHGGKLCRSVISYWRKQMSLLYPFGLKDIYRIYFGPEHPFTRHAPVVI